jgi:hypothetical protein
MGTLDRGYPGLRPVLKWQSNYLAGPRLTPQSSRRTGWRQTPSLGLAKGATRVASAQCQERALCAPARGCSSRHHSSPLYGEQAWLGTMSGKALSMNFAIAARVTGAVGQKRSGADLQPAVIPSV